MIQRLKMSMIPEKEGHSAFKGLKENAEEPPIVPFYKKFLAAKNKPKSSAELTRKPNSFERMQTEQTFQIRINLTEDERKTAGEKMKPERERRDTLKQAVGGLEREIRERTIKIDRLRNSPEFRQDDSNVKRNWIKQKKDRDKLRIQLERKEKRLKMLELKILPNAERPNYLITYMNGRVRLSDDNQVGDETAFDSQLMPWLIPFCFLPLQNGAQQYTTERSRTTFEKYLTEQVLVDHYLPVDPEFSGAQIRKYLSANFLNNDGHFNKTDSFLQLCAERQAQIMSDIATHVGLTLSDRSEFGGRVAERKKIEFVKIVPNTGRQHEKRGIRAAPGRQSGSSLPLFGSAVRKRNLPDAPQSATQSPAKRPRAEMSAPNFASATTSTIPLATSTPVRQERQSGLVNKYLSRPQSSNNQRALNRSTSNPNSDKSQSRTSTMESRTESQVGHPKEHGKRNPSKHSGRLPDMPVDRDIMDMLKDEMPKLPAIVPPGMKGKSASVAPSTSNGPSTSGKAPSARPAGASLVPTRHQSASSAISPLSADGLLTSPDDIVNDFVENGVKPTTSRQSEECKLYFCSLST